MRWRSSREVCTPPQGMTPFRCCCCFRMRLCVCVCVSRRVEKNNVNTCFSFFLFAHRGTGKKKEEGKSTNDSS